MVEDKRNWPNIVVGRPCGVCIGVARSLEAYQSFVDTHPKGSVYSVGEPAHNPIVIKQFEDQGVVFVKGIGEVPPGKNVAFQPHGNTEEDEVQAKAIANEYVFTECPFVTSVKKEIAANTAQGITTIYYGQIDDKGQLHPETRAALSAGEAILITSLDDVNEELLGKIPDPSKVGFACQTTHNMEEVSQIAGALRVLFPKLKMREKNEDSDTVDLCSATTDRQRAARAVIAAQAKSMVVVGDRQTSSNTRNLAKEVERNGARVIVVNTGDELNAEDFWGEEIVGIAGSASATTPQIESVISYFTDRGSEMFEIAVADESKLKLPKPKVQKS